MSDIAHPYIMLVSCLCVFSLCVCQSLFCQLFFFFLCTDVWEYSHRGCLSGECNHCRSVWLVSTSSPVCLNVSVFTYQERISSDRLIFFTSLQIFSFYGFLFLSARVGLYVYITYILLALLFGQLFSWVYSIFLLNVLTTKNYI